MRSSMQSRGAIFSQPSLVIPDQARINPQHMLIARIGKGLVRQLGGLVEKSLRLVFGHWAIVGRVGRVGHSYFPGVLDMPTSSLFFPNGGYPNASEFFGGLRK